MAAERPDRVSAGVPRGVNAILASRSPYRKRSAVLNARFDLPPGPLLVSMAHSDATAARLLKFGVFGADLIRFPAGGKVADHTHPGAHVLVVLSGSGWVDYEGVPHRIEAGTCYLVPPGTRHGIRADSELTILSVANDHRDAGAKERLVLCVDPK